MMLRMMAVALVVVSLGMAGCFTTSNDKGTFLTNDEISALKCKKPCTLSPELRRKMLEHGKELHLTPEERQVLQSTGRVILCGKCGYILNSAKYKKFEKSGEKRDNFAPETGFAKDSIRHRVLRQTMD